MRFIVILTLLLPLIACDPDVEIENISPNKLLAVTCFISPQDTLFKVYVFRASEIGSTVNTDSAAVKDALVTISDGNKYDTLFITFEAHPITGRKSYSYTGKKKNLIVTTNSTYFLNVQTPSGEKASAMCTIPPEPGKPTILGEQEDNDFKFFINWSNIELYKYFILILDAEGTYENTAPGGGGKKIEINPSLLETIDFPSDAQVVTNSYEAILLKAYLAENAVLHVTVRNIDEGLFKYYKSYERYDQWQSNNSGNLFPNFQEMPLIYSNIDGGVGIFAGFNDSSIQIEL